MGAVHVMGIGNKNDAANTLVSQDLGGVQGILVSGMRVLFGSWIRGLLQSQGLSAFPSNTMSFRPLLFRRLSVSAECPIS
jgi:hypothetical protein